MNSNNNNNVIVKRNNKFNNRHQNMLLFFSPCCLYLPEIFHQLSVLPHGAILGGNRIGKLKLTHWN